MFEGVISFFKKMKGAEQKKGKSKNAAKERLHLVLIQDRASISADFLDAMKQEIIDVIKKYIEVDESAIDVKLTNQTNEDGTNGAPALYANIPITNVKAMPSKAENKEPKKENKIETKVEPHGQHMKLKEDENVDTVKDTETEQENKKLEQKENNPVEDAKVKETIIS